MNTVGVFTSTDVGNGKKNEGVPVSMYDIVKRHRLRRHAFGSIGPLSFVHPSQYVSFDYSPFSFR
jgi:hypothetical protein